MSTAAAGPARATRREWIGLAVLALPCLLYAMDLTVLSLAVPQLSAHLHPSSTQLLWISDVYGFLLAGSLITMGTLGDRIGRRRLLLIGSVAFGLASTVAAFSTSAAMLIAARAVLGIAGATLAPSTLSLLRSMFLDPRQRAVAVSVWITSFSAGAAVGPVVGGALLEWFWWGSVFLVALPVMALLLVAGPRLLPEFRDPDAGRPDLPSAALSLTAVLAVIYGLKQAVQSGMGPRPALALVAGLAIGVVFVRRQQRLADPLLDLRLFRVPGLAAAVATYTLGILVVFGADLFIAQYLQLVLGMSPLRAGLWSAPSAVGFVVGSMLTPLLVRWVRPATVIATGLSFAAAGFALITRVDPTTGLAVLVIGSVVFGLGIAPAVTLSTDLVVGAAPPERAGAAAAMSETGAELGGALGIAVLGSIGAAVYRGQLADTVPAGVPVRVAAAARDTLGGAIAAADRLPDQLGGALLTAARAAFTHGLQVTAGISAAVVIATAVMAGVLLRRVPAASDDNAPHRPEQPAKAGRESESPCSGPSALRPSFAMD